MGKNKKDNLGERMKRYEAVSKMSLVSRMPIILRLDGCHFHSFCKGFVKPFDDVMIKTMQDTMLYLCKNIQGCVLGYTQSDEITLVLVDYKNLYSQGWFDNEVQKMCSVAAAMCTMKFNELFKSNMTDWMCKIPQEKMKNHTELWNIYLNAIVKGGYFDCRAFNVPKEDVTNCLLWRQRDAERNSKLSLAQAHFSHKEMQNKNCSQLQDMLHELKGINWNNLETTKKRGSCCIHVGETFIPEGQEVAVTRMKWVIDNEIPIFSQDRNYIEKLINF